MTDHYENMKIDEVVSKLIERLRSEADISTRPGQMDRLNALADEFAVAFEAALVDAERYRWIRDEAGLMVLPYDDHGLGPEFPSGSDLDKAIDQARRAEGDSNADS